MRAGYTLVEVLIGTLLCALLVGVVLIFAVQGVRLWRLGAEKVDVNESALLAMHGCQALLSTSDVQSVYINPTGVSNGISFLSAYDGTGNLQFVVTTPGACATPTPATTPCGGSATLSVPPPQPYSQDGYLLWQKWQILYLDTTTRTIRLGEIRMASPSIAPQPYRLSEYSPASTDHIVAKNVDTLEFSSVPFGSPSPLAAPTANPVYVRVVTSQMYGSSRYATDMTGAMVMENGFTTGHNTGEAVCCK